MRTKIAFYILGLTIHTLVNITFIENSMYQIMGHPVSLIAYIFLGAIPFFIELKILNLIALQIILFLLSFTAGGIYNCTQYSCGLAGYPIFYGILLIFLTAILWGIIRLIQYFAQRKNNGVQQ